MDKSYLLNVVMQNPGLAIKTGGSAIVKAASAFLVKANGVIGSVGANQDMAGLATAKGVGGAPTSNLTTGFTRVYTFIAEVNPDTGAVTYSVVHGGDFANALPLATSQFNLGNVTVSATNVAQGNKNKAIIGYAVIENATGSDFVPGTTALDTSNLTVTYINAFGFVGL